MSVELTERQQAVVQYVRDYHSTRGLCPTLADVAAWLGVGLSTAQQHVAAIVRKGALVRDAGIPRSIRIP